MYVKNTIKYFRVNEIIEFRQQSILRTNKCLKNLYKS